MKTPHASAEILVIDYKTPPYLKWITLNQLSNIPLPHPQN